MAPTIFSFSIFFMIFLAIGLYSATRGRQTKEDYYLASRNVAPSLVGLSAVATNLSGYMFIGVIGYTYVTGLASIWLMLGWIAGDFIASIFIHKKLRMAAERTNDVTFGSLLSRWNGTNFIYYRRMAAIITIIFLGAYAAAQFAAGGKALNAIFGWDQNSGAILVSVVVILYCLAGGIRASIWTDAAQAFVMLLAMTALFFMGIFHLGGIGPTWEQMRNIPNFLDWFPSDLIIPGASGMLLFALSWMFAGLSVIGQPHVMIRFMALDTPRNMTVARIYYYGFFAVFYALATGVGMLSRIYLPDLQSIDPELALPRMAQMLMPSVLVGIVLAGLFAATMSTADSLVLSCSAALTHDLLPKKAETTFRIKLATGGVTALALGIALSQNHSVFNLVILTWSTLASAFGPLLIVYAMGGRPGEKTALAMCGTGIAIALIWRQLGWHDSIYEGMPGILSGLGCYLICLSGSYLRMGLRMGLRTGLRTGTKHFLQRHGLTSGHRRDHQTESPMD